MKAYINLEDAGDGSFFYQVCYEGGFDLASNAHQHAYLVTKYLDGLCQRLKEPDVVVSPQEEEATHGHAYSP